MFDTGVERSLNSTESVVSVMCDASQDLCRIKWDPDPDEPPQELLALYIPDSIKIHMFKLFEEDPVQNSAKVRGSTVCLATFFLAASSRRLARDILHSRKMCDRVSE